MFGSREKEYQLCTWVDRDTVIEVVIERHSRLRMERDDSGKGSNPRGASRGRVQGVRNPSEMKLSSSYIRIHF